MICSHFHLTISFFKKSYLTYLDHYSANGDIILIVFSGDIHEEHA